MSWFKCFFKKTLASVLAIAVVLCSITVTLSVFANTQPMAEVQYQISSAAPALPMYVGTKIDLTKIEVQINGAYVLGEELVWEQDASSEGAVLVDNEEKALYVFEKGNHKITAKNASGKQNIWVLANEKGDNNFILASVDTSGDTTYDINNKDWMFSAGGFTADFVKKDWAVYCSSTWNRNLPTASNPYFGLYDGKMMAMYFNMPILSDFTDYTVCVDISKGSTIYNANANFGIVVKANIDFDAELDSSIYVGGVKNGMYLAQRCYGTMAVSSFDKPYYSNETWSTAEKPLFTITDEQAKTTLAGTSYSSGEKQNATYSIVNGDSDYRTVTIKMQGDDLVYKLDGTTVFDSSAETVKGIDNIYNVDSTFTTYNYEEDILPSVTTAAGNSIGILDTNCAANYKNIKAVLNEVNIPDFAEDMYTVSKASPAIPMYEGTQVNLSKIAFELTKGVLVPGGEIEWSLSENYSGAKLSGTTFLALSKDSYLLYATYENVSYNIWIIVNEKGDNKFVLATVDTSGNTVYDNSNTNWLMSNAGTSFVDAKKEALSSQYMCSMPATNKQYVSVNAGSERLMFFKFPILSDFTDYTVNASVCFGTEVYSNRAHRGIVVKSNINFDTATGSSVYAGGSTGVSGTMISQFVYGTATVSSVNTALHSNNNYGANPYPYFSNPDEGATIVNGITDEQAKATVAGSSYNAGTKQDSTYSILHNTTSTYREMSVKMVGEDLVYSLDGKIILDTAAQSVKKIDDKFSTSTTVSSVNYDTDIKPYVEMDAGNSIGIVAGGIIRVNKLEAVLNEAVVPDFATEIFRVTNASPAIAAFAGTKVDISGAMIQLTENGNFYMATELEWSIDESNTNNAGIVIAENSTYIAPLGEGVYTLRATKGSESSVIYIVANAQGDYEFLIEDIDFTDTTNTAIRDTANWYAGVSGSYPIARVENIFSLAGTNGRFGTESLDLWQSYNMNNHFYIYDSEILKNFADYTVTMDLNTSSNAGWPSAETGNKATNGIIARATVSGNTSNVFASGSTAINIGSKNFGGVKIKSISDTKVSDFAGDESTTLHTVDDVSLVKYETSNPSYILSRHTSANQKRRLLSAKLEGNHIVYSVDGKITFDSSKEIKTLQATFPGTDNSDNYNADYVAYEEGTYSSYATDIENANLGKGTVGFSIVRSTASIYSIKVKLNNTETDEDLLPYEDYNYSIIPANSGFYTSYLPKVSSSEWAIDEANSTANYYVNDGGYITVLNDGNELGKLVFNGTDYETGKAISYELGIAASTAQAEAVNSINADIIADSRVVITEPENGYFAFAVPQDLNLIPGTVNLTVNEVDTPVEYTLSTAKAATLTYKAAISDISAVRFAAQFEENADKLLGSVYNYNIQYKEGTVAEDTGIRFQTAIPAVRAEVDGEVASNANISEIGAVIIPTAILGEGGLTEATVDWSKADAAEGTIEITGAKSKARYVAFSAAANTYTYHTVFNALLNGLDEQAKQYDISCVTYIKYNDDTITYGDVAAATFNELMNTDKMLTSTTFSDSLPDVFDEDNIVLTFPVLSDTHFEASDSTIEGTASKLGQYTTAINNITAMSVKQKIDLVCVAGDLTSAHPASPGNTQWWKALSTQDGPYYNPIIAAINEGCGGTATTKGDTAEMTPYYRAYERDKALAGVLKSVGTEKDDANLASVLSTAPKFLYALGNHDSTPQYLNSSGAVDENGTIDGTSLEYIASFMGEGIEAFVTAGTGITTQYTDTVHAYNFIEQNKEADNNAGVLYDYFFGSDLDKEALHSLGNRHMKVNGFNFLAINPTEESKNNFSWLKAKLEELTEADPAAPIFVVFHFRPAIDELLLPNSNTKIDSVLKDYPQVIMFGGHSHTAISFDNTFMQSDSGYYSFDCGSIRYLANYLVTEKESDKAVNYADGLGKNGYYTGLLVEVDNKGNTRVSRINAKDGTRVGNNIIIPAANKDGSRELLYTASRKGSNIAPSFSTSAASAVYNVANGNIDVTFPNAITPNTVWRYELTVTDEITKSTSAVKYASSLFFENTSWNYTEPTYNVSLTGIGLDIVAGGVYTVKITAVDNWGNRSKTIETRLKFN